MSVRLLIGDCRERLAELPDESVHCVVTSPPYWGLRDYGVAGQIGLEATLADYLAAMVGVFGEVRRVLRKDGTLWLNIGDAYAGSFGAQSKREGEGIPAIGLERFGDGKSTTRKPATFGLKPKDRMMLPARVALALQDAGWWLRDEIIWHKPNPMPISVKDRTTPAHEWIFMLSRSRRYFYDADAIREDRTADDKPGGPGSAFFIDRVPVSKKVRVPAGWDTGDGPHGNFHHAGRSEVAYADVESDGRRNKRSVWTVASEPFPEAHFATFPSALIEPCIKAGCPVGGTVLDPFGGAGTTGLVADRLGRSAILIELNPEYASMGENRIRNDAPLFAEVAAG